MPFRYVSDDRVKFLIGQYLRRFFNIRDKSYDIFRQIAPLL